MYYSKRDQKIIFEEGDWVVHKPDAVAKAFKLGEIDGEVCKNSHRTASVNGRTLILKNCRLASQDEIDAAMAVRPSVSVNSVKDTILELCRREGWI